MKILILACEYLPTNGGIAYAAHRFARQMRDRGMNVQVCSDLLNSTQTRQYEYEGISVNRFAIQGDASIWNPRKGESLEFLRRVNAYNPDLIVIHGWQGWPILFLDDFRRLSIPVILQSHGFGAHKVPWRSKPPFGLRVWIGYLPFILRLPAIIRQMHALIVLDKKPGFTRSFDHWTARIFSGYRVLTIPNGVPEITANGEAFFQSLPELRGKKIVLCVANYCDRKNQLFALRVAKLVKDPAIHFVFIGDTTNEYLTEVKNIGQAAHLQTRVHVLHDQTRAFCESAIAACHLALLTSKFEMQPLFLIEAMSCGKPWISTRVGSVEELQGGHILPLRVECFAREIEVIVGNPQTAVTLGADGRRQWAAEFEPGVVFEKWHDLLLSVNSRRQ